MARKLNDNFISVREAAKILSCGQKSIEVGLRNGSFPIGIAWHTNEKGKYGQWNYRIPRFALIKFIEEGHIAKNNSIDINDL